MAAPETEERAARRKPYAFTFAARRARLEVVGSEPLMKVEVGHTAAKQRNATTIVCCTGSRGNRPSGPI